MERKVLIPACITLTNIEIVQKENAIETRAGCCRSGLMGGMSTNDAQEFSCTCQKICLRVEKPNRCNYLMITERKNPRIIKWLEEWTGLKDISVEIEE